MASIKQFAIECAFAAGRFGALPACPSRNGRTDWGESLRYRRTLVLVQHELNFGHYYHFILQMIPRFVALAHVRFPSCSILCRSVLQMTATSSPPPRRAPARALLCCCR
jgi:hypothetical protein